MAPQLTHRVAQLLRVGQLVVAQGRQDEHPHRQLRGRQMAQQEETARVRPLHVVEDEDDGIVGGSLCQQPDDGGEEKVPLGVAVRRLGLRNIRDAAAEGGDEARELRAMSTRVVPEPLFVDGIDVVAERFGEELVRRGHVLLAVAEQDGGTRAMGGASRFGQEGGLPEAGFTAHEHDLSPFTVRDTFECCGEHCRLHVATNHSDRRPDGQACLQRDTPTGLSRDERLPDHLDRVDGIGQALQRHGANRSADVRVPPACHQGHDGGRKNLTAFADAAQTGCFDDTVPVVVAVVGSDLTAAQPDPQSHAVRAVAIVVLDALLHGDGAGQRGGSGTEGDHDSVAQPLDLVARPCAATACRNTEKYPRRTSSAASGDMASDSSVDPTTSEKRTAKFSVVTQHLPEHHVAGNPSRATER